MRAVVPPLHTWCSEAFALPQQPTGCISPALSGEAQVSSLKLSVIHSLDQCTNYDSSWTEPAQSQLFTSCLFGSKSGGGGRNPLFIQHLPSEDKHPNGVASGSRPRKVEVQIGMHRSTNRIVHLSKISTAALHKRSNQPSKCEHKELKDKALFIMQIR